MLEHQALKEERETYHFLYRLIIRLYKYTYEVEREREGGREGGEGGGGAVLEDPITGKREGGREGEREGGQGGGTAQARALFEDTIKGGKEGGKEGGSWGQQKVYWLNYPLISPVTHKESGRGGGREGRRTPFAVSLVEGGGERMLIIFRGREGGREEPREGGRRKIEYVRCSSTSSRWALPPSVPLSLPPPLLARHGVAGGVEPRLPVQVRHRPSGCRGEGGREGGRGGEEARPEGPVSGWKVRSLTPPFLPHSLPPGLQVFPEGHVHEGCFDVFKMLHKELADEVRRVRPKHIMIGA